MRNFILCLTLTVFCLPVLAQSTVTPDFTATKAAHYCPRVDELVLDKKKRIWSAQQNNWKSYETSFAVEVDHFLGAQWLGIKIGQVACIYAAKTQYTFPVLLVYNKLVRMPTEQSYWKKDSKNGRYHCITNQISQCPFYPVSKRVNNNSSDLEAIRQQTSNSSPLDF